MLAQFQELSALLDRDYPDSRPKLTSFPSGAAMLDVIVDSEIYVMEYLPSLSAVGISRMSSATFGWEGFENSFDDFQSAKEFLLSLLRGKEK